MIRRANDNRAHGARKLNIQLLAINNLQHIKHIFGVKRDTKRFSFHFERFELLGYAAQLG